jgi:hypothetical protein
MLTQLVMGYVLLVPASPSAVAKRRARLLGERDAAGPDSRIRYKEAVVQPDIVSVSIITGALSLISVAFLFGPAAIISGGMAASRGYGKGILGMVMGIAGIVGWIVVFSVVLDRVIPR